MGAYLGSIWNCRHFWLFLIKNDLQMRYRRSVLGVGWSLLHPLAAAVVTCAVFHAIFHMDVKDFGPFILCGLAWWAYMTGVTTQGCQSYVQAESYIRQRPLPIAVYPLRVTLGAIIHLAIALTLVLLLTWVFKGFGNLPALVGLVPAILLLFLFGWSVAILVGYLNVVFRDVQHFCDVCFQILFYLTPIVYPPHVVAGTRVGWLVHYNPLTLFLKLVREPILEGRLPSLKCYAAAAAITLVLAVAAAVTLRFQQRKVVLYL